MPACLVNGCLNRTGRKGQSREIVLHKFPNDPMRIRCWLLQTGQNFQNLESLVEMIHEGQKKNKYFLCSSHFAADAYIHARVLRQDAVPSIFPPIKVGESIIQESLKKVRVRSKKRPLEWTSTENMGVQPSSTSADMFTEDADIRQFTWTGNMDVQSSSASADTFPGDTDIKSLQWTTNVDVQSSSASADTFPEDTDIKSLQWTTNVYVQSSSTSEDTDIKPLRWTLTANMDVQSRALADTIREDVDIKPLRLTWTGNMDVQSSGTSVDTFPEDLDIKPLQWTTNVDVQSSSTSEDTDIKPLQWTLTANMDGNLSCTSMNIFPEDTDIKPSQLALTGSMDVQSSSATVHIFSEDTNIKPLRLIGNVDVQSCTSTNIFTEDTDIKPDISKPSCCTIETQTEFTLCNATVTFLDQEDKPPADPVVTETPVLGLQGPVLSTPTAPAGKIGLFTGHPGLCFFVDIKTTC